jgi:phage replication-related protein YjqB (UPF0714/DUF867 family)
MGRFNKFSDLARHALAGKDFIIEMRDGNSGFGILAPHGGGIEPGTAAVADAIAGRDHAYYAFKGIRPSRNRFLHIASSRFDEPGALSLVHRCHTIITIHGCREGAPMVYVGGRHDALKKKVGFNLMLMNIPVSPAVPGPLKGLHRMNLCNRGRSGKGVQLEISSGLRRHLTRQAQGGAPSANIPLAAFANAVRQALQPSGDPIQQRG